jgi:molybdopterin-containing oxidoreductase family iron-sulfur binding subunit
MSGNVKREKHGMKRRDFLKIVGITGGTAALSSGCSSDVVDKLIPYVVPPEDMIPGIPKWYPSTCTACPGGCGILVKNREGRAIKVEGNPKSPINSGTLCAMGQSLPQELYNPDRLRAPLVRGVSGKAEPIAWEEAEVLLATKLNDLLAAGKAGRVVFLTNHVTGTYRKLIKEWLDAVGGGRHYAYEAYSYEPIKKANEVLFGISEIPTYRIDKADFILSFGADFLETWLSPTLYQRQFSLMHSWNGTTKGKLVQIEPRVSLTGASADVRVHVKPGTEGFLALGMANAILEMGLANASSSDIERLYPMISQYSPGAVSSIADVSEEVIVRLAEEFARAKSSLAIGGGKSTTSTNATETQIAVNILNYIAGNFGKTVNFSESQTIGEVSTFSEMASLVESMRKGEVEILLVHNTNPAFTLPRELGFGEAVEKVPFVVSFSSFEDETSRFADLLLPDHTNLEKWDDYTPRRGVYGIVQPAVVPVFNTKQTGDVLLSVSKRISRAEGVFRVASYYDYLRESWKEIQKEVSPGEPFEQFWIRSVIAGGFHTDLEPTPVRLSPDFTSFSLKEPEFKGAGDLYLVAYPSYKFYDGRGANKPWLQELPDALTTVVWDSWVEINPETARALGVGEGDFVSVESTVGKVEAQVFVYDGIRRDTVAIAVGQGHTSYGRYAKGAGVNPIELLPASLDASSGGFAWLSARVKVTATGKRGKLVKTQNTMDQAGRAIAVATTMGSLVAGSHSGEGEGGHNGHADFYPKHTYLQHRWGMTIDLDKCTGCGACVVACYAENNIPVVGKLQVAKRREMSWIRIERYFERDENGNMDVRFIPMTCQHCENAPCEPVCPVYATYTNPEGLNAMVYSRCVGTRYCSNNCTYKVRRFNWFNYQWPEPLNWQLNPDVTVRGVGVMEKCTFCVQRIHAAKEVAKNEGRTLRDGEVKTACQQTCPSQAIVFGDINSQDTEVSKMFADARGYRVLEEINTQPAITYLKKVKWDVA